MDELPLLLPYVPPRVLRTDVGDHTELLQYLDYVLHNVVGRCDYVIGTHGEAMSRYGEMCGAFAFYAPRILVQMNTQPLPTRCRQHAPLDWTYALRPYCRASFDCHAPARYGTQWLRPKRCAQHARPKDAICIYVCVMCKKKAAKRGIVWKLPTHCADCFERAPPLFAHALMRRPLAWTEHVVDWLCPSSNTANCQPRGYTIQMQHPDLIRLAEYNAPTTSSTTKKKECPVAKATPLEARKTLAYYGIGGVFKPTHCQVHVKMLDGVNASGYADVPFALCTELPTCNRKARYAEPQSLTPKRCALHQRPGIDVNVYAVELCMHCHVFSVSYQASPVCALCAGASPIHTLTRKPSAPRRETLVLRALLHSGVIPGSLLSTWDTPLYGFTSCSSRPDLIILNASRDAYIVLEVNEFAHSRHDDWRDPVRDRAMRTALSDRPMVIMHYNPDGNVKPIWEQHSHLAPTREQRLTCLVRLMNALYTSDTNEIDRVVQEHQPFITRDTLSEADVTYHLFYALQRDITLDEYNTMLTVKGQAPVEALPTLDVPYVQVPPIIVADTMPMVNDQSQVVMIPAGSLDLTDVHVPQVSIEDILAEMKAKEAAAPPVKKIRAKRAQPSQGADTIGARPWKRSDNYKCRLDPAVVEHLDG